MSRCLHALLRFAHGRGLPSAGLALVLLLGAAAYQEPAAPEAPGGASTLTPVAPPAAAAAAPRSRAVAPRPAAPPQAAAVRPRAPRAAAAPRADQRAQPRTVPAYGPMERDYERSAHGDGLCPADAQGPSLGITCRGADVRTTRSGYLLRFSVCTTTAERFELRFLTEAEVDVRVLDTSGREVWTWQPPRPFLDEPHVLLADLGSCWVWETSWAQVDDRGRPLPPGTYDLRVDFLEVDDSETYEHRFSAGR